MITYKCRHGVFFNEKEYIVCLRKANTLFVSQVFEVNKSLDHLAFFIAHAMSERFSDGVTPLVYRSPGPTDLLNTPDTLQEVDSPDQRNNRHGRTDSNVTIVLRGSSSVVRATSLNIYNLSNALFSEVFWLL
jgi:hypothetical protein